MPNFVSSAAIVAELAHGDKSRTQSLTHPAYLMPQEPKLSLRNISATNMQQACVRADVTRDCGTVV